MRLRTWLPAMLVLCILLALMGCEHGPVGVELQIDPVLNADLDVPLTVNANSFQQSQSLEASMAGTYDSYKWSLDGSYLDGQTTASLVFDISGLAVGNHELTAWAMRRVTWSIPGFSDLVHVVETWYSNTSYFTVHP